MLILIIFASVLCGSLMAIFLGITGHSWWLVGLGYIGAGLVGALAGIGAVFLRVLSRGRCEPPLPQVTPFRPQPRKARA
ncbi:MAG: hypothetical protein QM656_10065 [Paracoccaceae bacterium]